MGALQSEGGRCNPRIIFAFKARKRLKVPGEKAQPDREITEVQIKATLYQCSRVGDVLIPLTERTEEMLFIA